MRHSIPTDIPVRLDLKSKLPLTRQLYDELRRLILTDVLPPGTIMPSSRSLADHLEIARSTVIESYRQLEKDGYIEAKAGSVTRVSHELPRQHLPFHAEDNQESRATARSEGTFQPEPQVLGTLSSYARRVADMDAIFPAYPDLEICFYPWRIARDATSLRLFSQTFARLSRSADLSLLDFGSDALGYGPLREAIARSLHRGRGIKCSADQIMIASGMPQVMHLISRVHVERGDFVGLEDPGYTSAAQALSLEGASIMPLPVDQQGLVVDYLEQSLQRLRLVYVTPSHQYPTGAQLSLPRRLQLLTWAKRTGTLIVEDEYDSEFGLDKPAPALKTLDQNESVLFVGSFSKTLFPSLSIAYMVLPPNLVQIYNKAKMMLSDPPPVLLQATIAEYMQEGLLARHIRRMRTIYNERRQALISSLQNRLGERAQISGYESGLNMMLRLDTRMTNDELVEAARKVNLGLVSTDSFYFSGRARRAELLVGYADLTENKIDEGVARLASILD